MCINKENFKLAIETLEKIAYESELNENFKKQADESIIDYAAKVWCLENQNYVIAARETLKKINPNRYY